MSKRGGGCGSSLLLSLGDDRRRLHTLCCGGFVFEMGWWGSMSLLLVRDTNGRKCRSCGPLNADTAVR